MDFAATERRVLPENPPPKPADSLPTRRKNLIAAYAEEAFEQRTTLEGVLTLLTSDTFSHVDQMNQFLEQAVQQTADPLDKLRLMQGAMPEINKSSKEIRALTALLQQLGHQSREYDTEALMLHRLSRPPVKGAAGGDRP